MAPNPTLLRERKIEAMRAKVMQHYSVESMVRFIAYHPTDDTRPRPVIVFTCTCGEHVEAEWRHAKKNTDLLCFSCLQRRAALTSGRRPPITRKFTTEAVQTIFRERGAEPTFTEYTGPHVPLTFVCACGKPGQMTFRNLYYHDPRSTVRAAPRCSTCFDLYKRTEHGQKGKPHLKPFPSGTDHPNYNPSLTDADRLLTRYGRGPEFHRWCKEVLSRAHFTCQITGDTGVALAAHHLYPWARYPARRFDLANGVCIRRDLHAQFHHVYGHTTTFADFAEFYGTVTETPCPYDDPYPSALT